VSFPQTALHFPVAYGIRPAVSSAVAAQ
jgi:hypothetical protein